MNSSETIAVASRSFSRNEGLISALKQKYSNIILNQTGKTLKGQELVNFLRPADKAIIGIEEIVLLTVVAGTNVPLKLINFLLSI